MDFGSSRFLKKYLSNFNEDHPLLVNFESNVEYMNYVEDLLKDVDGTPNLEIKIGEMKDPSNWESAFSELEFARKVKALNPEFIKTEKASRTPDLKVSLLGKDVFFEVRLLLENDEARHVTDEIGKIESDLIVFMTYGLIKAEQTDKIIDFVKSKINTLEIGSFQFEGMNIEIRKRPLNNIQKTSVVTPVVAGTFIDLERIRSRVFQIFYEKLTQLRSRTPIFLVIDCQRWQYSEDTFKSIILGDIERHYDIGLKLCGFADIVEKYARNPELFNETELVPVLTYPRRNGLCFLKDAECINGVVSKTRGKTQLILNPFAGQQFDSDSIRQLRTVLAPR